MNDCKISDVLLQENLVVPKGLKVMSVFVVDVYVFLLKKNNKLKSITKARQLNSTNHNNHKVRFYLSAKYVNEVSTLSPLEGQQKI